MDDTVPREGIGGQQLTAVAADVFAVDGPCPPDGQVRALLVCGTASTLLIDSLSRPTDLEGVSRMVQERGRPLLLANSHADWDHWWGNAAFPGAPVIAHRLTQSRQQREGRRSLAAKRRGDEAFFAGVTLRPATVAFDGRLDLNLGGLHVEISLLPGHTRGCTVAYIPERRLLFAGDAAEDPIPLVTDGPIAGWPEALLDWARRARIVVPAHGRVSGPELLERNAAYLRELLEDPGSAVPELEGADAFYRRAHRRNLKRAAEEEAIQQQANHC